MPGMTFDEFLGARIAESEVAWCDALHRTEANTKLAIKLLAQEAESFVEPSTLEVLRAYAGVCVDHLDPTMSRTMPRDGA